MLVSFVSHQRLSKCSYYLDESLAAVREGGVMYLNIRNQTSSTIAIKAGTVIGKATPATFVFQPVSKVEKTEVVNRITVSEDALSYTSSDELSSLFHNQFPSPTEDSEAPLSEAAIRKRTDPELLKQIPGPDLKTVA